MELLQHLLSLPQLLAVVVWVPVAFLVHTALLLLNVVQSPKPRIVDLRGCVCLVTGSNTGIGLRTAVALLKCGATVVFACRSRSRAQAAMDAALLEAKSSSEWAAEAAEARFMELDLSSLASVRSFVRAFRAAYTSLDVCVLNAGLNTGGETVDGLDQRWQVNYLGHWLVAKELFPLLCQSARGARVVCLSSVMHWFGSAAHFTDHCRRGSAANANQSVYADSKLAMNYLALELQRRFEAAKEEGQHQQHHQAVAVNPGAVASDIWRGVPALLRRFALDPIMALIFLTPDEGSATSFHAATQPLDPIVPAAAGGVGGVGGGGGASTHTPYFVPYFVPFGLSLTGECLGPFAGVRQSRQNLPRRGASNTAAALWNVSEKSVTDLLARTTTEDGNDDANGGNCSSEDVQLVESVAAARHRR